MKTKKQKHADEYIEKWKAAVTSNLFCLNEATLLNYIHLAFIAGWDARKRASYMPTTKDNLDGKADS